MKKIVIAVICILGMLSLSGCTQQSRPPAYPPQSPNPPNILVTGEFSRFGYEGIDYVVWIDVIVRNFGGKGSAKIYCQINQDNNKFLKMQNVYLDAGKSTEITFRFAEYSWWSSDGGNWRTWVENL